jgi:hypothetical protein
MQRAKGCDESVQVAPTARFGSPTHHVEYGIPISHDSTFRAVWHDKDKMAALLSLVSDRSILN